MVIFAGKWSKIAEILPRHHADSVKRRYQQLLSAKMRVIRFLDAANFCSCAVCRTWSSFFLPSFFMKCSPFIISNRCVLLDLAGDQRITTYLVPCILSPKQKETWYVLVCAVVELSSCKGTWSKFLQLRQQLTDDSFKGECYRAAKEQARKVTKRRAVSLFASILQGFFHSQFLHLDFLAQRWAQFLNTGRESNCRERYWGEFNICSPCSSILLPILCRRLPRSSEMGKRHRTLAKSLRKSTFRKGAPS